MGVRITTWNVNGIRNPFSYQPWRDKRSFVAMFDILEADIVVLQETKIQRKDLKDDMVLVPGWDCYFSLPKHEKGKFGVVIYTRQSVCAPIRAEEGITGVLNTPNTSMSFRDLPESKQIGGYPTEEQASQAPEAPDIATDFLTLDSEGRCVILEFPAFVLIGVYNPATRDASRTAFRIAFLNLLERRVRNLVSMGKRVVLTGDLNIAKTEIDMANCEADLRKAGMTVEEYFSKPPRRMLNHLVDDGIVWGSRDIGREVPVLSDLCRRFHPTRKGMFTCWETKINARPGNYGSRIDYVLCSLQMEDWFLDANIQEGLMGSDHCPVYAIIKDKVHVDGKVIDIHDIMNPPGMFEAGRRLREYSVKDMQPTSGKLIPEFNGRRSIKDMFSRKSNLSESASLHDEPLDQGSNEQTSKSAGSIQQPAEATDSAGLMTTSVIPAAPVNGDNTRASLKRAAPDTPTARKPPKQPKSRSGSSSVSSKRTPTKGQQSLVGFFKSKATVKPPSPDHSTNGEAETSMSKEEIQFAADLADKPAQQAVSKEIFPEFSNRSDVAPCTELVTSTVSDPIQSKESWSKLFAKPAAPLCEGHEEPCKTMQTKKPGPNCGRSFWMCAKPLGPSGQKEKNTQWRCSTFIWCSDYKSGT